ncbi:MAG: hypothetical protein FJ290_00660 [Planctomycetes bacterium]|nr:hypothetical protein [Planctomycetota bacterium]
MIGEYGYAKYLNTCRKYAPFVTDPGVSGYVWTQISDIENERNGLMTYDRSKFTEDPDKVAAENEKYYREHMRHSPHNSGLAIHTFDIATYEGKTYGSRVPLTEARHARIVARAIQPAGHVSEVRLLHLP